MARFVLAGIDLDPYLALNGVEPEAPQVVGEERLAFGGGCRADVAARKRAWAMRTVPLAAEVAEALRRLVQEGADADVWSFNEDLFSAQGLPLLASSGAAVSATSPLYGAKALSDGGNRLAYAAWSDVLPAGAPWTLMGWRRDGPFSSVSYRHWLVTSAGGLYLNGVASAVSACFTVDSGGVVVVNARDRNEGLGAFATSTAYALGARISVVVSGTVYIFHVTVAGTSGGSAPSWTTTFNGTTTSGTVTFRNDGRGGLQLDDLVLLPFAAPSAWVSQLYTEHSARAWTAPQLRLAGDLVSPTATVRGSYRAGRGTPHKRPAGTYEKAGEVVEFRLEEE